MRIVSWRAWYANEDESGLVRFDSSSTSWEDLPRNGALAFLLYYLEKGTRIMVSKSWYWTKDSPFGTVYCCDDFSDAKLPEDWETSRRVKEGLWVHDTLSTMATKEANSMQKDRPG